jgi:plasmid maintenance system antidote protein VapI
LKVVEPRAPVSTSGTIPKGGAIMETTVSVGEFLREELEARAWSVAILAQRMGGGPAENERCLTQLIEDPYGNGRLGKGLADQLGEALGMEPRLFLEMDCAWREQGWHVVGEVGPPTERGEIYLVTVFGRHSILCLATLLHNGKWRLKGRSLHRGEEIVAWRPAPEPYRP